MAEPPLRDAEIRMLRGMIDEYAHDERRRQLLGEFWTTGRKIVVFAAAVSAWLVTIAAAVVQIAHG